LINEIKEENIEIDFDKQVTKQSDFDEYEDEEEKSFMEMKKLDEQIS
jgi:hypothetical protein